MILTKEQLKHGQKITCEIDGVKIEDARIKIHYEYLYIQLNNKIIYVNDEEITSDKYKIRLVEEEKDTEVITVKRWVAFKEGYPLVENLYQSISEAERGGYTAIEVSIPLPLPKPKEITVEEAEKLLEGKYKII